jgi:hypothetical protein
MDINNSYETADVEKIIDIVSEVVSRWNSCHNYDNLTNNCQTFVDDLLSNLGITLKEDLKCSTILENFLKKLRQKGECELEYDIPEEFQTLFEDKKRMKFSNHQELDSFVNKLFSQNFQLEIKSFGLDLLKGFDRAFWLRYFQDPNDEICCPQMNEDQMLCPFGDPRETKSFGKADWIEEVSLEYNDFTEEIRIFKEVETKEK